MSLSLSEVEKALEVLERAELVELYDIVTTGDDWAIHVQMKGGFEYSMSFDEDEFFVETKREP